MNRRIERSWRVSKATNWLYRCSRWFESMLLLGGSLAAIHFSPPSHSTLWPIYKDFSRAFAQLSKISAASCLLG
ncbi:hypothetical protein-signal peptide prediction [Rhodopirellula baltica SH 1]|uniref:Uncharacterized protein n=1 Tax=Rhodopirellula baltica (strain DSM 10527 / NCIMB 13988 / SH1) TaxID=243090 RepID=Q7URW2_RHOBA|nr:hypothetical protein-signal peptide prediction [Rhodopirellula baltica SH 1]